MLRRPRTTCASPPASASALAPAGQGRSSNWSPAVNQGPAPAGLSFIKDCRVIFTVIERAREHATQFLRSCAQERGIATIPATPHVLLGFCDVCGPALASNQTAPRSAGSPPSGARLGLGAVRHDGNRAGTGPARRHASAEANRRAITRLAASQATGSGHRAGAKSRGALAPGSRLSPLAGDCLLSERQQRWGAGATGTG